MQYLEIREIVRNLRKNMTVSEKLLWQELRNRKLDSKKFNKQHPIFYDSNNNDHLFFVADFFCHECRLIIELDGPVHDLQKERDNERDLTLQELGYKVLHIRNEELEDMEKVKKKIKNVWSDK